MWVTEVSVVSRRLLWKYSSWPWLLPIVFLCVSYCSQWTHSLGFRQSLVNENVKEEWEEENWEKRWEDGRVERRETDKRIWLATLTFLHAEREHCLSSYPTFLWALCFPSSLISSSLCVMSILNRLKERLPCSFVLECAKQLLKQRRTKKSPNVVMLAPGLLDRCRYSWH